MSDTSTPVAVDTTETILSTQQNVGQQFPVLQVTKLQKKYGSKVALNSIDATIAPGRIVGLLGPNGSGKTTLIKLIMGLLTPTSGEIIVDGKKVGSESKAVVSYLPDRTYLNEAWKIKDVLKYFADFYPDFDSARALQMLSDLNISENDKLKKLSKGNKEKVQLILVMSRRAKLYLLDEPIAGVDPAARDYILETVIKNYDRSASIVISTHLIQDVENVLDEFIFLKDGNINMVKSVEEIKKEGHVSVDALFREVYRCS